MPGLTSVRCVACVLIIVALAGCASHQNGAARSIDWPGFGLEVIEDVRFVPEDWSQALKADVHRPDQPGVFPGVLLVHGGGWESRSREDMRLIANRLARRGFVAVNIDYRFAPEFQFPAQLHDVQMAIRWMRDEAAGLNIDPERLGALGFSSGAHLVSLAALVAGSENAVDQPYGGLETCLDAVVAGGLPADFHSYDEGKLLIQFLGGDRNEVPEAYELASPLRQVHGNAPPHFLFHGTADRLVPITHAEDFMAALEQDGVHVELYRMRARGHVGSFLTSAVAINRGSEFLAEKLAVGGCRQRLSK
ncbi:MAG: alpha/beta hydrolase fold domain-containing protein [Wenzhouxiangella sp.]